MKDKLLGEALEGLGITGDEQRARPLTADSPPARPLSRPAPPPAIDDRTPRELRRIFLVLLIGLAIYAGQAALTEWRYREARQAIVRAGQAVQQRLGR